MYTRNTHMIMRAHVCVRMYETRANLLAKQKLIGFDTKMKRNREKRQERMEKLQKTAKCRWGSSANQNNKFANRSSGV